MERVIFSTALFLEHIKEMDADQLDGWSVEYSDAGFTLRKKSSTLEFNDVVEVYQRLKIAGIDLPDEDKFLVSAIPVVPADNVVLKERNVVNENPENGNVISFPEIERPSEKYAKRQKAYLLKSSSTPGTKIAAGGLLVTLAASCYALFK